MNSLSLRNGLRLGTQQHATPDTTTPTTTATSSVDSLSLLYGTGGAASLPVLPSSGASATLPQLRGLDWRLDIDVARRHVHDLLLPSFFLRLSAYGLGPEEHEHDTHTKTHPNLAALGSHAISFTSDFATLKRAAMSIDEAAAELKTPHAKRVTRYIS